ncbi:nucleoside recognition domain-containing protein [Paenibacillus senegalimassiliensis]|uniref:nucleoside recognition domain-containing protein n=1 Tax=Paenibacillus senegalimassiliensis TaxID=1737426 RepID=UPI00073F2784|nr:nucleoside recognition domain-containing protein [Paenibacillus senegalimassiliensis]
MEVISPRQNVIMLGLESSGKSTLFRGLTGQATGEEANFRGSTITARRGNMSRQFALTDLPGIRGNDDSLTTRMALDATTDADILMLVVRAMDVVRELPILLSSPKLQGKRTLLILTFADKIPSGLSRLEQSCSEELGIPVYAMDARTFTLTDRTELLSRLKASRPLSLPSGGLPSLEEIYALQPQTSWLEHPRWGSILSVGLMLLIFALPVFVAYLLSTWLQPGIDQYLIEPVKIATMRWPQLLRLFLVGDYGMLTLGIYSFLWAFPVVLLLGLSVAVTEESGLKDRITQALDGPMQRIGLHGRDLIPVLSGFGCNVVAVFQSRACSACTRRSCVSLIAYGSACSYQIGASLSVFGSAGYPWLFVPYILVLGFIGAWHTRIWNRGKEPLSPPTTETMTFLQKPELHAVSWRVRAVIKQFLLQAMPIFLLICLIATAMQASGLIGMLSAAVGPLLRLFHLPEAAAGGIIFSIVRKDGLLVLNQGEGELLRSMSAGQIFLLVYLASTLTACLVTLWTIKKELGWSIASALAGKQLLTSLVSSVILLAVMNLSSG